ncbi:MAG TPA: D-alanyl-D-alanine carboxypeptidase family protein [Actinomycetes bacterium]|nr:D-alanyl-D-alanine carboxypeptidase family protein [Actinomycetes bacterium]
MRGHLRRTALLTAGLLIAGTVAGLALPMAPAMALHPDPLREGPGVVVDGHEPPRILAKSWIVVDAESGDVLAAKNAHDRLRPASTLKTLTAITLLPRLNLDDSYRVQWEDAHVTGSAVGIVPGSRYTIDELFYGLMLPSGNDAARALASANGGRPLTVRQMNETADSLGANDTNAANPTGLDAPRQLTSAFDLAIFAREGLTDRDFRRYVSTVSFSFPAQEPKKNKKRDSYMIYNQNPLLLEGYRGVLGVKTGYTTEAGRTFVAAAERGGRTLIVALMGIVESSDAAAERLLQWGWTSGKSAIPVGSLTQPEADLRPSTRPSDPTTSTEAAGLAPAEDQGDEPPSVLVWSAAGALLIGAGWWLQRRRSAQRSRQDPGLRL